MANTGHMDDDHSASRPRPDIFGSPNSTLHLRETDEQPDDAEARMRQALGLFGTRPSTSHERSEPHAAPDRRPSGGTGPGARRHRFVQDGEVPVSVVRGRQAPRPATQENDRASEELAELKHAKAELERRLADREIQLRSLQTRIGHAELERDQAHAEAREWREKAEATMAELASTETALVEAQNAALAVAAAAIVIEDDTPPLASVPTPKATRRRRRPDEAQLELGEPAAEAADEPEPVKWWI